MKKQIWLAVGIAGMLLSSPVADVKAAVNVQINMGRHPFFVIDSAPSFIYLRAQGFSISVGNPYDIVYYGNYYYIYHNARWYRSSNYHGPWILILNNRLPYQIRRHRWEDIRRYRDIEYRRSDHSNNQYQRNDDNRRRILDQRNDAKNRRVQVKQNKAVETRRVEQQNKAVETRRVGPQNKAVETRRVEHQNKAVETRRVEQQNKAVETRRVEHQNKAVEIRRVQEQPKKGTVNKRTQEEQGKGGNNNDKQNNGGKRN